MYNEIYLNHVGGIYKGMNRDDERYTIRVIHEKTNIKVESKPNATHHQQADVDYRKAKKAKRKQLKRILTP